MSAENFTVFERSTVRHGTQSGYRTHQERAEEPCEACKTAKREYDARWRSADVTKRRNRLSAKSQQKAYGRLARLYPDIYRALYTEERERLFREAGLEVWIYGRNGATS